MGNKDDRQDTGFGGPASHGVLGGYRPEHDSLARARYDAPHDRKGTPDAKGRLDRIRRFLRHLLSDV
jgi:hypothetical protein